MNDKKSLNVATLLKQNASRNAIYVVLVAMCIILAISHPAFTSPRNVMNIIRQVSVTGFLAVGMMFVIITGGIDLTVGSIVALAGAIGADFAHPGQPVILAILIGIALGAVCGLINGIVIAFSGIAPFIVTLGMMTIIRGITLVYTEGQSIIDLSNEFTSIGGGFFLGIPIPVWLLLLTILVAIFLLNFTKFGRHVFAIGGNELAAQVSGVNVKLTNFR